MSKLIDMKLSEYLETLKSKQPAPGGGSVSALAGAQGAALLVMVCDLTLGREKYTAFEAVCRETRSKGEALYEALTEAVDRDTEAFNAVSTAFKLPKETSAEKDLRSAAIADATLGATEVPFEVMETAFLALQAVEVIVGKSNPTAASDLGVSALSLLAAVKGAWLNVLINLSGVKEQEKANAFREKGSKILQGAEVLAAEILEKTMQTIDPDGEE